MSAIETEKLTKRFKKQIVLNEMSFGISQGTIALIAGQNGTGKTTWIRVALGLSKPTAGQVYFDGLPVHKKRNSISVVFDEPALYPHISGRDNIRFLSGVNQPDIKLFLELREMLGLTDSFLKMKGKEYSLGQRRRIAVCAALIRNPRFLFLDEPTIGLDPVAWAMVKEALMKMRERGTTILLTGQALDYMEGFIDKVVDLGQQTILFDGSVSSFISRNKPALIVNTRFPEKIQRLYPRAMIDSESGNNFTVKIICEDETCAETELQRILDSNITIQGVTIAHPSLEEAFVSMIHEGRTQQ